MLKNLISTAISVLFIALAWFVQTPEAQAAPGDYDPSFGLNGVSEHQLPGMHYISRIALQKDGKILVAGYAQFGQTQRLVLRRHNANGSLDTSFGNNGEAVEQILPPIPLNSYRYIQLRDPSGILVQSDGKILIGGSRLGNDGDFLGLSVWRFSSSGLLDKTFDGDGHKDFVNGPFSLPDRTATVEAVNLTKSIVSGMETSRILVLCTYQNDISVYDIAEKSAIFRLNLDGSDETNFGVGGKVEFDGEINDLATDKPALSLTGDLIYAAGVDENGTPTLWRLTSGGAPDTSFGSAGKVAVNITFLPIRRFKKVILQPDGKILVSGETMYPGFEENYIFRLFPDGTPDPQFGYTTIPSTNISGTFRPGFSWDLGLQSDGKIISCCNNPRELDEEVYRKQSISGRKICQILVT